MKKHHYGFISRQNKLVKAIKEEKKKNRSDEFLPYPEQRIKKKIAKKFKKN